MTKQLNTHKDYTELGEPYQLVLPLSLEGMIPEDDSVRLLSHELEDLDDTMLYKAYSSKGRNPAVEPKTMFKIITYAYSQGIYSSRKIRRSCLRDITSCGSLQDRKRLITVRSPDFVPDFWQKPAKTFSISWYAGCLNTENFQKKLYS